MFNSLVGWILQALDARRRVRCTVHKAALSNAPDIEHAFIKVTNISATKDVEITHVWFDTHPRVDVMNPHRRLPKRLKPDETWETWIETSEIPEQERHDCFERARVRLSVGRIIRSKKGKDIPPNGYVAGP